MAADFRLSENLLNRMASGNGFDVGGAAIRGYDKFKQDKQERIVNRQKEDALQMQKDAYKIQSDTHRVTMERNQREEDMLEQRRLAVATGDKELWVANEGAPSEFDQLGTLDEQKVAEDARTSGDHSYSKEVLINGIPHTQAFNAQAKEIGDPVPIPANATAQAAQFHDPKWGKLTHRGVVVDENNMPVGGHFTSEGGDMLVNDGIAIRPMLPSESSTTNTQANNTYITGQQFIKVDEQVTADEVSFIKLQRYMENRDTADQGIGLVVDQFVNQVTTIFGGQIESDEDFAAAVANGQLQGLLGAFREEIVGGGVMTEFDAERVLMALGGNLGLLQNKEVVGALLIDIMKDKYKSYEDNHLPTFNRNAARNGRERKEPVSIDWDKFTRGYEAVIKIGPDGLAYKLINKANSELRSSWELVE